MLIQNYFHYFFQIATNALTTLSGVIALLLFLAGILAFFFFRSGVGWKKFLPTSALILLAAVVFAFSFYNSIYEFEQPTTRLSALKEFPDDADCGTAWTPWISSGIGLSNPCEKGCYRGLTLRQQMRMVGLPPWPENRREFQCWKRQGPAPVLNRGQEYSY